MIIGKLINKQRLPLVLALILLVASCQTVSPITEPASDNVTASQEGVQQQTLPPSAEDSEPPAAQNIVGDGKALPSNAAQPLPPVQLCKIRECPDLDVTFISREPRYERYDIDYNPSGHNPTVSNPKSKRWPEPEEEVLFTAHVKNKGSTSKAFGYQWLIDEQIISSGIGSSLAPESEATFSLPWRWNDNSDGSRGDGSHSIAFVVDPLNLISEESEANNRVEDATNALSMNIVFSDVYYDVFNSRRNGKGTYSAEDWIRWQFEEWEANFRSSTYPTATAGALQRVRIDNIIVLPPGQHSASLDNISFDGAWVFAGCHPDVNPDPKTEDDYRECAELHAANFIDHVEYALQHELTHQLGIIDLYRMNLEPSNDEITGGGWIFPNMGLMGGGNRGPHPENSFSEHTVLGLNSNLGFRRGYYGEYLYDIPPENVLHITDIEGQPLAGATVRVYQKNEYTDKMAPPAIIEGITDRDGSFQLPNRPVQWPTTTETGHTLRPNPFGDINVVGMNGLFLVEVRKFGQIGYYFLPLTEFNKQMWSGIKSAEYEVPTTIIDSTLDPNNLALMKPTRASSTESPPYNTAFAVDGDTETPEQAWSAATDNAGEWWQVDLGQLREIYRVDIYPHAENHHDWYQQFHIEISETGDFSKDGVTAVIEEDWDRTRAPDKYPVSYVFPSVPGRFVRVIADKPAAWTQLQEFKVYALAQ